MKTKIVIAGGTGFLGHLLVDYFKSNETDIVILSRKPIAMDGARVVFWDSQNLGAWTKELDGAKVLINLAGRSVNCRYTQANKNEIITSRVMSTRILGKAVQICRRPPRVWLNSSSATIYRHAEDCLMDEETGETCDGFSAEVCRAWENEFFSRELPYTRRVALRIAMVLGNAGGILPVLNKLCRMGLGGKMGEGNQYISWLHQVDFCRTIEWLINNKVEGVTNITSPNPVTNKDFMALIRKSGGVAFGISQRRWMLELGAILLQTETELVLKSRRVAPKRLLDAGFVFNYPELEGALKDLAK